MRVIYKIVFNERFYIGSAKNFKERIRTHLTKMRLGYHHNAIMQNVYKKYGEDVFIFSIIEEVGDDVDLYEVERGYLEEFFGSVGCANLTPIAGGGFNFERTPEIIAKQLSTRELNGNWFPAVKRIPVEAIKANTGSKRSEKFCGDMSKMKTTLYEENPDLLETFKLASSKGRAARWERDRKEVVLYKDGKEYGKYTCQMDISNQGIMSQVSINQLCLGKKQSVKGFSVIPPDEMATN